jgi:hypothetical protein
MAAEWLAGAALGLALGLMWAVAHAADRALRYLAGGVAAAAAAPAARMAASRQAAVARRLGPRYSGGVTMVPCEWMS